MERRLKLANGDLVRLLGIDPFLDRAIRPEISRAPFAGRSGGEREDSLAFLTDERAVLLEENLARELGLAKGSVLNTLRGRLKVIGIFPNPSGEPLILMDIAHAQKLLELPGKIDHVDLILTDESGFVSRWQEGYRIQSKRQRQETFGAMVGAFRLNLEALSLMALFVSVFLIYNTAMFAVVSRRRDAGILRSLGASRAEVARAFLTEIALFGILGGLLGSVFGYLLSRALTDIIGGTISSLYFFLRPTPMPWSWWIPAAGIIVGFGASLLGSLLPLLELTRVDPVLTLRGRSGNRESRRWAWLVALAGVFILVASIIVLAFFSKQIYVAYIGVFGFLFGLSLLTGVIMVLAEPLLRRLLGGVGKLPGRIAAGNIIQNLGRTGVAVAAFMVALSLSIGLGSMIGSFRESLIWWMGSQLRGDMYISNASDMEVPENFYEEIRVIPGIGGVDTYRKVPVLYRGRTVHVAGIKADVLQRFARFGWVAGGDEHWEAVKKGDVIVSESFARSFAAGPGSEITLEGSAGPVRLRIEGVFYDYSTEHGLIMMDRETYIGLYGDRTINSIAVFIDPAEPREKADPGRCPEQGPVAGAPGLHPRAVSQQHPRGLRQHLCRDPLHEGHRDRHRLLRDHGGADDAVHREAARFRDPEGPRVLHGPGGRHDAPRGHRDGDRELRAQLRRGNAACHPAHPRHQFEELQLDDLLLPRLAALRHHGGNGAGRQRRRGALPDLEGDADVSADADPGRIGFRHRASGFRIRKKPVRKFPQKSRGPNPESRIPRQAGNAKTMNRMKTAR